MVFPGLSNVLLTFPKASLGPIADETPGGCCKVLLFSGLRFGGCVGEECVDVAFRQRPTRNWRRSETEILLKALF